MIQKPKTTMPTIAAVLMFTSAGFWCTGLIAVFCISLFSATFIFPVILVSILLIPFLIGGLLTVFGAIYAIQRKYWEFALAASIIIAIPFNLLGIVAFVLLLLSKNEFDRM